MSALLLSPAELVELTGGLTQGAAQARFIRKHYGVKVVMGIDGRPKVIRSDLERQPARPGPSQPNFGALREAR
jgi:hypothetical protein